ncbi:MAG: homocysteine S-methyltransferase family protein [Planctomycetota bacterium]|jgi:methionine synthase I (cobalamin-dependent)
MSRRLDQLFPGSSPVLLDGGMGTSLRAMGWPVSDATVMANLHAPELVAGVHTAAVDAGARVLHTNTFGALLGASASDRELTDAVASGARIARKAATNGVKVAGSLDAYDLAFHGPRLDEVVKVLVDEGVDLLVFETVNKAADAIRALDARREYGSRLPCVVCASTTDGGRADMDRVLEVVTMLMASGEDVEPGLNCCRGPHEAFKVALTFPSMPRWIKPSTGLDDDPVDDNVMAAFARAARLRGARFVGACCGGTADTLVQMGAALDGSVR